MSIKKLLLREDWQFLNGQLEILPTHKRGWVKRLYREEFIAGMDAEPSEIKKANAGRRRANSWLLEQLENGYA